MLRKIIGHFFTDLTPHTQTKVFEVSVFRRKTETSNGFLFPEKLYSIRLKKNDTKT
jgi:hypothetical protein